MKKMVAVGIYPCGIRDKMKLKVKRVKMVEAYFISPRGNILPIFHGSHISEVIAEAKTYGLTSEVIAETYQKHKETMPKEGYARDEVLTELLKNGWVRARIKNGYLYCQIGFESKRTFKNIIKLVSHLRLVMGMQQFKALGLRVYIVSEVYIINEFDMLGGKKELCRRIR